MKLLLTAALLLILTGCPEDKTYNTTKVVRNTTVIITPDNTKPSPVPEPASMILLGSGMIILAGLKRRKR